MLNVKC